MFEEILVRTASGKVLTAVPVSRKESDAQGINWDGVKKVDSVEDAVITLTNEMIATGRGHDTGFCPVAQGLNPIFGYTSVGKDSTLVGVRIGNTLYKVRYRSGVFPRMYDRAVKRMSGDLSISFKSEGIDEYLGKYTLKAISATQSLANKRKVNKVYRLEKKLNLRTPKKRKTQPPHREINIMERPKAK
jgi:hypothetical protein